MEQMVEDLEVDTNVMIFRVKLFLARTELNEAMSRTQFQMATEPPVKDIKLDVTDLPTRVLKHLITSGIVRGKIFESSDAFACLSCNPELQAKFPGKRNAFIYIKGPHHQSLLLAVDTVEMLLDEVVKRNTGPVSKVPALERYWSEMREVDYEIKDFPVAAIKNVISRGIIRGKVNEFSGAVVSARGNPHLSNPPQNDRTLYLHIQAPDHHSILLAIQAINRLLHEVAPDESSPPGEMLTNNSGSQATMVKQPVSNSSTLTELPAVSTASPSESMEVTEQTAVATEQTSLSDVIRQLQQYIEGSEERPSSDDQMKQSTAAVPQLAPVSTPPQHTVTITQSPQNTAAVSQPAPVSTPPQHTVTSTHPPQCTAAVAQPAPVITPPQCPMTSTQPPQSTAAVAQPAPVSTPPQHNVTITQPPQRTAAVAQPAPVSTPPQRNVTITQPPQRTAAVAQLAPGSTPHQRTVTSTRPPQRTAADTTHRHHPTAASVCRYKWY